MHATIDVRFDLRIDDAKTLPLATLAETITEQNIEATLIEEVVECFDEKLVEAYCGEKYARGNADERYQCVWTITRQAVTTAGEHELVSNGLGSTRLSCAATLRDLWNPVPGLGGHAV